MYQNKRKGGFFMRFIALLLLTIFVFAGCHQPKTDQSSEHNKDLYTDEVKSSQEDQRLSKFDGYEISKQRRERMQDDQNNPLTDPYSNEDTMKIAEHLKSLQEVNRAQVVEIDDRIVIGVILNRHSPQEISNMIEQEARKIMQDPNKDVIVYTDETYWDHERHLKAKSKATKLGDAVEDLFDDFFNIKN